MLFNILPFFALLCAVQGQQEDFDLMQVNITDPLGFSTTTKQFTMYNKIYIEYKNFLATLPQELKEFLKKTMEEEVDWQLNNNWRIRLPEKQKSNIALRAMVDLMPKIFALQDQMF
mmetsp:Transcript_1439/g.2517  ORF Transcript_1439/g.2517 Transcript_1439/m.2517 type:complete len:116 (+) Transcript_1439:23-370(+)